MALAGVVHGGNAAVTTAGTAVPLSATKVMANWILIQPKPTNTGKIYLAGSDVSSTVGVQMSVGDADVVWPSATTNAYDLSTIYIDASVNGEGVKFIYTAF